MDLTKIKGLLGICTAKGCFHLSKFDVEIKELNITRHLCYKHTSKLATTLTKEADQIKYQVR